MTSFDGLLSLADAALMWGKEESTIRRAILSGRFEIGKECKKYGKQWVLTDEGMKKVYGEPKHQYVGCSSCRWNRNGACRNPIKWLHDNPGSYECGNYKPR